MLTGADEVLIEHDGRDIVYDGFISGAGFYRVATPHCQPPTEQTGQF